MDNRPIGIFDSGLGGLTVLKALKESMPSENFIYFGDSKRTPYGSKSKETIVHFSNQDVRFLLSKDVKAVVIACNTVSSNAVEQLKENYQLPSIEVIHPGASLGVKKSKNKKIGVIGTEATILSQAYQKAIKALAPDVTVFAKYCPLFVPLVEEGKQFFNCQITRDVIAYYLAELSMKGIDTLVLGCTHYPLLKEAIDQVLNHRILLVDSADEVARQTKMMLKKNQIMSEERQGKTRLYTSDSIEKFIPLAKDILGVSHIDVQQIDIEKF